MKSRKVIVLLMSGLLLIGCLGIVYFNYLSRPTFQGFYLHYSDDELVQAAHIIAKGKITKKIGEFKEEHSEEGIRSSFVPFTQFEFAVNKYFKDDTNQYAEKLVITHPGGFGIEWEGHPLFEKGKNYLLFLEQREGGYIVHVGGPNGKFEILADGRLKKTIDTGPLKNLETFEKFIIDKVLAIGAEEISSESIKPGLNQKAENESGDILNISKTSIGNIHLGDSVEKVNNLLGSDYDEETSYGRGYQGEDVTVRRYKSGLEVLFGQKSKQVM